MSTNPYAKRSQMAPASRMMRAYAAPVNRASGTIAAYDPHRPWDSIWIRLPGRGLTSEGWRTSGGLRRRSTTCCAPERRRTSRFSAEAHRGASGV